MRSKPIRSLARGIGLLSATALPALAVQYGPERFDFPDGTTNLGDGTTIASSDGTASVQGGELLLTLDDTADTHSSFRVPALADSAQGWTASFEFVLADLPGGDPPADGFSFSYGAIPAYNSQQADPAAADAHGSAEEGWHPTVTHLAFEFDTWRNGDAEQGFNISLNGNDLAFENRALLEDGRILFGKAILSWSPADGASMSVDLGEGLQSIFANVPTPGFAGNDAHSFAFSARTGGATQGLSIDNLQITTIPPGFVVLPTPIISEFMADNANTLEDDDCRSSDWLELFNATAAPVNLAGWFLTDDPNELTKWQIPDLPLEPNGHRVIFASGKDQREGELHADFALEKSGGFLALVMPDGTTVASSYTYGEQVEDISYGSLGQAQTVGSFGTPTPGALNVAPQGNLILEKPVFSLDNQVITAPVSLALTTTVPDAVIRYTTNGSSPTASSPIYANPITITTTTRVTARLFAPGKEPGPVRDRTFVKLDSSMVNVRSEIPLIIIDSFGRNLDAEAGADSVAPRRPVHAIFIDVNPETGRATPTDLPDFEGRGGMRVRGQTSSGFPKKQYSFETWDSEGNDRSVSIFGYPSESDWVIHAPYSDKTLMRNKIVYDSSRDLGYPASRTRFCEVYFNSNGGDVSATDYRGVYVFMEKIKQDEDRVDIKKLENCDNTGPALTGGYLFKKDKGNPPSSVTINSAREGHRFEIIEPDPPTTAQKNWLDRHIDTFENILHDPARFAHPTRGYPAYLDVQSFIDTHIWVEVYKNIDGYRLSSYFYKDRGRKIVASPVWDYNLSLGNADYLTGENPTGWYYSQIGGGGYPWYGRLFQDPEFEIQYWDRYFELREGILHTAAMMDRINGYYVEIRRAGSRNFGKWTNLLGQYTWPNAPGWASRTTHQAEVNWMKTWLTNRFNWIDSQHSRPPAFSMASGPVSAGNSLTMTNPNGGAGQLYYTTDGSDPRLRGGGISSAATNYSTPLPLDQTMTVKARVRTGTSWSPLQTEFFLLEGEPASAANLVVSEIHYRPAVADTTESGRGFDARGDFEFIEIMNIGSKPVDLRGVQFTGGIEFRFDLGGIHYLQPGDRATVVSNLDAFELRNGDLSDHRVAGEFNNSLSNDGETILLVGADGTEIRNFTYNDRAPWPEAADGLGPSLVLVSPSSNPDHNDPLSWRSSLEAGGTPGSSDGSRFAGDPDGDDDGNGIGNFLQYALAPDGVEPTLPGTAIQMLTVGDLTDQFLTLSYTRNLAADDVDYQAQVSEDLVNWLGTADGVFALVDRRENGDGTETITLRLQEPVSETAQLFGRLVVEGRTP